MVELTLLGAVGLTRDGRSLTSVLAQPKRLAVLAYLALAPRDTFRRRDSILALFWPEYDDARARAALNTATHYLRRTLGPGVIVSRGKEELGLARSGFRSDVTSFEEALDGGRVEEGLASYGGDLMPGLHLSDAGGFERWLESERVRLRRRALDAAGALADRCAEEGRHGEAVAWARRAVELAPSDELALRRIVLLLAAAGDHGTALEEFERYRLWISQQFGAEPSESTLALVRGLRDVPPVAVVAPPAPARAPRKVPDVGVEEATGARGRRGVRRGVKSRTIWSVAAIAVAAGLLFGAGDLPDRFARGSGPAAAVDRVAVLPFTYQGDERFGYLAQGVADLLTIKLQLPGQVEVADSRAVLRAARKREGALDLPAARSVAARFGAELVVFGSITEAGGRLEINAVLYEGERMLTAVTAFAAGEPGIFEAVDEVAASLLVSRIGPGEQLSRTAAVTTGSLAALKAYLEAEAAFRSGLYGPAMAGFERAAAIDPSFALAHYRLGVVADWVGRTDVISGALERAWQRRDRLPRRVRYLVDARILRRSDPAAAEALLRAELRRDPYHVEALAELADVLFHHPQLGGSRDQIRTGFERALALDPTNPVALLHLARLAAFEEEAAELDRLVSTGLHNGAAGELALELRTLRAFALHDLTEQARVLNELRPLDDAVLARIVVRTINHSGGLHETRALTDLLRQPDRQPDIQALGTVLAACIDLGTGRFRAARVRFDSAATLSPRLALIARGVFAAAPELPTDSAEMDAVAAGLGEWENLAPVRGVGSNWVMALIAQRAHPLMVAGFIAARRGDASTALRHAAALDVEDAADPAGLVRAAVALHDGSPAEATRLIRSIGKGHAFDALGLDLLILAAAAERLGRNDEALGWYTLMTGELPLSFSYRALSQLRAARIQERIGDTAATENYARFARSWADADAEFQPLVADAAARAHQHPTGLP